MQKEVEHKVLGKILYTKRRNSRGIRVSVDGSGQVKVSLPYSLRFAVAEDFVEQHLPELQRMARRQEIRQAAVDPLKDFRRYEPEQIEQVRREAHAVLPEKLAQVSAHLNRTVTVRNVFGIKVRDPFSYRRLALKNNRSNWGSCSTARNINLNIFLVKLPVPLMEFIMVHELCHLVYHNHSERFHRLVDSIVGGREKALSAALKEYKLR